ncbi:hypothetical protein AMECASPLE_028715 [Ameca splendens]|uniref:Uncharacterized protein n=1 Tax=Ameca splendens TaxID=208324 RepID=A0ABV0XUI1_9TELE
MFVYVSFLSFCVCTGGNMFSSIPQDESISGPIYTATLSHENKAFLLWSKVFFCSLSLSISTAVIPQCVSALGYKAVNHSNSRPAESCNLYQNILEQTYLA